MMAPTDVSPQLSGWRLKGIGALRIVFGVVWAVDAWFKWQPGFVDNLVSYITGNLAGQPPEVRAWIHFWHHIVGVDPRLFAYVVAVGETAIAIGLIFGLFSNLVDVGGALMAFVIWSAAEGFGGPYTAGSTDIGASVIYILVFAGLFLSRSGLHLGLDARLTPALGRWGFLASGDLRSGRLAAPRAQVVRPTGTFSGLGGSE
jgi:uncharacterized membrane protein YphA (DoxX/SURF4 family)